MSTDSPPNLPCETSIPTNSNSITTAPHCHGYWLLHSLLHSLLHMLILHNSMLLLLCILLCPCSTSTSTVIPLIHNARW